MVAKPRNVLKQDKTLSTSQNSCARQSLTDATKRRLWSESGGYCANPQCEAFLFDEVGNVDFAEMAHIIAASSGGPRDVDATVLSAAERADHSNVVVLCANCHTKVDKAPDTYPIELLKNWKTRHEETLQRVFGTPEFPTREAARAFIASLLEENKVIFELYGPLPTIFSEARTAQWRRHVVATIVPNNAVIERILRKNLSLLGPQERRTANVFTIHAFELAARHLMNDWTPGSTRFPDDMATIFEGKPV